MSLNHLILIYVTGLELPAAEVAQQTTLPFTILMSSENLVNLTLLSLPYVQNKTKKN